MKINNQIFHQIQKNLFFFFDHFPNFGGKTFFRKNPVLSQQVSSTMPKLKKKLNIQFQDGRTEGRMEEQILFFRKTFWLLQGIQQVQLQT